MILTFFVGLALVLIGCFLGKYLYRSRYFINKTLGLSFYSMSLLSLLLVGYIAYYMLSGLYTVAQLATAPERKVLNPGIEYTKKLVRNEQTQAVIHIMKINRNNVDIFTSRPSIKGSEIRNVAQTTTEALNHYQADIAINASFFKPFSDYSLLYYYPRSGDHVIPIGTTVADNILFGERYPKWPFFIIKQDGSLDIGQNIKRYYSDKTFKDSIKYMLSGYSILLKDGKIVKPKKHDKPYPRSVIGLSKDKETLWLIVVDGKQPLYSTGIKLETLSGIMQNMGIDKALEFDGGGSATMAWLDPETQKPSLLSRPSHTKLPNRERPVANHIFIRHHNRKSHDDSE